jgi:hypothetical protein
MGVSVHTGRAHPRNIFEKTRGYEAIRTRTCLNEISWNLDSVSDEMCVSGLKDVG